MTTVCILHPFCGGLGPCANDIALQTLIRCCPNAIPWDTCSSTRGSILLGSMVKCCAVYCVVLVLVLGAAPYGSGSSHKNRFRITEIGLRGHVAAHAPCMDHHVCVSICTTAFAAAFGKVEIKWTASLTDIADRRQNKSELESLESTTLTRGAACLICQSTLIDGSKEGSMHSGQRLRVISIV